MTCETCGRTLAIGGWPFCPHDPVRTVHIQDDVLPGGARWIHNLDEHPVWVETKTQFKAELAARGLIQVEQGNYNRNDKSPYATKRRLRIGQQDPFLGKDRSYADTFRD